MVDGLTTVIFLLLVALIFYLYNSFVIREIADYLMKLSDTSFHTSSIVAFYLTLFVLLRSLVGNIFAFNPTYDIVFNTILFIFLVVLAGIILQREYKLNQKKTIIMTFYWLVFLILFILCLLFVIAAVNVLS